MKTKTQNCSARTAIRVLTQATFFLIFLLFSFHLSAQSRERRWNAGFAVGLSSYSGELGNNMAVLNKDVFQQTLVGNFNISRYLNRSFDVTASGNYGTWGYFKNNTTIFKGDLMQGTLTFKYKLYNGYLLAEDSWIAPYIFAGAGATNYTGKHINNGYDYPAVAGAGIRLILTEVFSISLQTTYGYMFTAYTDPTAIPYVKPVGTDMYLMHMVGFNVNLGIGRDDDKDGVQNNHDKCPGTPPNVKTDASGCPLDADKDGVLDFQDLCPEQSGLASTKGCPDRDNDGVADREDQCPEQFGSVKMFGCPDSDNDGVMDSKDKCPNVSGSVALAGCPDSDNDGVTDDEDKCPKIKGTIALFGCPDTDGDGIEDAKDMCPDLKGLPTMNGCPDTDNDGVYDKIDLCPQVAGEKSHSGCPDTDNDGVYDDIDKCIGNPGPPSNGGCPEIKKETKLLFQRALQGIQFENGKDVIKSVSYPILDAIAKVMLDNPEYKLAIGGHTDNVGDDMTNMTLSNNRASAVSTYLIAHGVDPMRLTSQGYGETQPIDVNTTLKGRTRNRRVEFNVEFSK